MGEAIPISDRVKDKYTPKKKSNRKSYKEARNGIQ